MGYARSMLGTWPLQQSRNVDGLSSLLELQKGCQRARAEVQQAEYHSWNRTPRPGVAEGHRVHEAHTATVSLQAAAAALNAAPGLCAQNVKIIGLGKRGATVLQHLAVVSGRQLLADTWCLDTDQEALDACTAHHTLLLPLSGMPLGGGALKPSELQRLVGRGTGNRVCHDNATTAVNDAAIVLGAAGSVPGGAEMVLALVEALRTGDHFTAVVLARPFAFEGMRRAAAADRLLASLRSIAHLVVVIDQDAIARSRRNELGPPLTLAEAADAADMALVSSVAALQGAFAADEVLVAEAGTMAWHRDKDHRHPRLLMPVLQRILVDPGVSGAVGSGVVSIAQHAVNDPHGLDLAAAEAICQATQSPFLADALLSARAALCCLTLTLPGPDAGNAEAQGRTAVEAAAAAACQLIACKQLVLCVEYAMHTQDALAIPSSVEASLLVLHDGGAIKHAQHGSRGTISSGTARPAASSARHRGPTPDAPTSIQQAGDMLEAWGPSGPCNEAAAAGHRDVHNGSMGSVGDFLVDTLTAQSLELPPQAAKWRGAQRSRSDRARTRQVPPSGPVVGPMTADEAGPVDVRERMSSILESDRNSACPDD